MPQEGYFAWQDPTSTDPRRSFSGEYSEDFVRNLARAAVEKGIDPNLALGLAMAESNMGQRKWGEYNPLSVDIGQHFDEGERPTREELIDKGLDILKEKLLKYPNDTELAAQAYQGLGKLGPSTESYLYGGKTKWFGGRKTINAAKERPHGKRVMAFASSFRENPRVQALINSLYPEETLSPAPEPTNIYGWF